MKTWGRVSYAGVDYFCVDDGSGVRDKSGHSGIPVSTGMLATQPWSIPAEGQFKSVTGIVTLRDLGLGLEPVIAVRGEADIQ